MTTTPLAPTDILTPEPPPCIRVRDLIAMLQLVDPDAYVQVVTRVADEPDGPLDDTVYSAIEFILHVFLRESMVSTTTSQIMSTLRSLGVVMHGRAGGVSTNETELRYVEGIECKWVEGRKVVVVR